MKKNRFFILPILLAGLFAVGLLGCPTAAPEAKKKGGGDDGDDDPVVIKDVNFPFISPHSIVADILLTDAVDGETTLVITESADKPTIPNPAVITDGFIERELIKGIKRQVYMAQLSGAFNAGDSLGTHNDVSSLHTAFLKENTDYFLHLLYKKQGETALTHKSFPFKTSAFSQLSADEGKTTTSFTSTPNPALDVIEWRKDKENYFIGIGWNNLVSGATWRTGDGVIAAQCDPSGSGIAVDCAGSPGVKVVLFENLKGTYTIMWILFKANHAFTGTNNPRANTVTHNSSTFNQKVLIIDR